MGGFQTSFREGIGSELSKVLDKQTAAKALTDLFRGKQIPPEMEKLLKDNDMYPAALPAPPAVPALPAPPAVPALPPV